jgi:trimeric autotransporter adhesin
MKRVILQLTLLFIGVCAFGQSHTLHNNSTTILITPDAITTGHISGSPSSNTNLSVGKDALSTATVTSGLNEHNLAVGHSSLLTNASGSYNLALGHSSLKSNTYGNHNTSLGFESQLSNIDGLKNIAIGNYALKSNTTSSNNIGIGYEALLNNTVGNNLAIGNNASTANVLGTNNIAIGNNASETSVNASDNMAIGYLAASSNIYGHTNISIGNNSARYLTSSVQNVTLGLSTLAAVPTAQVNYNTANGTYSLYRLADGNSNSAFGNESLKNLTIGTYNVGIGASAGANLYKATGNVVFGTTALSPSSISILTTNTIDNNVVIGHRAMQNVNGASPVNISNNVVIGAFAGNAWAQIQDKLVVENSSSTSPLIGGDFALDKVGVNRLYTAISTDANTLQVGGKLGVADQINLGLDANSGYSYIKNSGTAASGNMQLATNNLVRVEINSAGILKLTNVPVYATNAAAITGGLVVGQVYKTATGQLMIVY